MSLQDDRRESFIAWMQASGLNMNKLAEKSGVQYNTIRSYVGDKTGKQTGSLTGVNEAKIASAYGLAVEDIFGSEQSDEGPPNNLRAWREFRFLTVDELAERVETTRANIEMLESQPQPPSAKWLRRIAPALETTVGAILDFSPNDVDSAALEGALGVRIGGGGKPAAVIGARKTG